VPTNAGAVLGALGDSTRRAIFECLLDGPLPVGLIAERVPVSRPAVSQHLRVLRSVQLVVEQAAGTRRVYRIDPYGLEVARGYFEGAWTAALESMREDARRSR
jgi:DNA-binding transcriptional ArsR family regulator